MALISEFINWVRWVVLQPWFSPIVNTITVPILAWTAWEALKTSRATSDANNLKLLPLLGIYFYSSRRSDDLFKIKNIGEGVAYDIQIDSWTVIMQDTHEIIEFRMSVPGTNILTKDEEKEILTEVYVNGTRSTMDNDFAQATIRGLNTTGIQIQFRDATGRKCACLIDISERKVNILKPTYRLGIFSKIAIWYGMHIQRLVKIEFEKFLWQYEERTVGAVPSYPIRIWRIIRKKLF